MAVRGLCLLTIVLAVAVALPHHGVETMDDPGGDPALGEGTGVLLFMKNGKMWTKAYTKPSGTVEMKTIKKADLTHGKCRYACFSSKLCGGYSFVMADHSCTLLSAPNFLVNKGANDAWHRQASEVTGAPYKPDTVEKAKNKMKKAINATPRVKSKKAPAKAGEYGPLPMRLEHVMNRALIMANMAEPKTGKGAELSEAIVNQLAKYRAKLYNEFYEKNAHDYEIRAEMAAKKKAHALAKKRAKKAKRTHPNTYLTPQSREQLYVQARKEVDNHAIRKYQRKFKKNLAKWATNKVFIEQERLEGIENRRKKDDQIVQMEIHREKNAKKVKGEDDSIDAEKQAVDTNEDAKKGNDKEN